MHSIFNNRVQVLVLSSFALGETKRNLNKPADRISTVFVLMVIFCETPSWRDG